MESTWPDEEKLIQIIARLVVLCDGAKKCKETTVGVGVPELLDPINTQRPAFGQLRRELAAMFEAEGGICLVIMNIRPVFGQDLLTRYSTTRLQNRLTT
jgi:hypothetical protein